MGTIIKKCLACGTLNLREAELCKSCQSPLLAEVDQEDEILSIDPMEAAINDTVSETDGDDEAAQILREQAEHAKQIVAKEKEKEERKKKRQKSSAAGGGSFGFSLGGDGGSPAQERSGGFGTFGRLENVTSTGGFKIKLDDDGDEGGGHSLGGGSLRMQAMRQTQARREAKQPEDK